MKKLIYCAAALVTALFAGSCQRELLDPAAQGNTVIYTVEVPDALLTKAIGDDVTKVDELVYEVYRTNGEKVETITEGVDRLLYHKTAVIKNGKAIVPLELINNQNFTVLFWAHSKDNGVYDASNLTNVTITSPDVANNVNAQAFVGRDFVVNSVSAANRKVTLTRPVSQLNIGTTEASLTAFKTPITLAGSSVKVSGLSTRYNVAALSAGEATDVEYEYTETAVPTERLKAGSNEYIYVGMNYIGFAANKGSTIKVAYAINTSEGTITNKISNVPVKPNYRTNIVGNLITSTSNYTIELDKGWGQSDLAPDKIYMAAALGGDFTLTEDVVLTLPLEVNAEMTINLNGHTISGEYHKDEGAIIKNNATLTLIGGTVSSLGNNGGSAVQNNGTMTIQNVTLNGAPNADGSWPSYTVNNTGKLTIINSTITSHHGAVASYGEGAIVTLNDSEIDMAGIPGFTSHGIYTYNNGTVIVNGGTYQNKAEDQAASGASVINGAVEVNSGDFSGRIENYYGRPVLKGGSFSVNPNKNFIYAGYKAIEKDGKYHVVAKDIDYIVSSSTELVSRVNDATEDITVSLAADLEGNISLTQKAGIDVTILGNGHNYKGGIHIWGNGASDDRSLTIKEINFDGTDLTDDEGCIYTTGAVNGTNSYACNVTIEDCTFTGAGVAAIRQNVAGERDWTIKNCTVAENMHSLLQVSNTNGELVVENCKVYSKNGANLNSTCYATFTGCEFDVKGYAVRVGVNTGGNPDATKLYTFTNCTLKSETVDGDDAVIIIRKDAQKATLNFVNSELIGDPTITGHENAKVYVNGVLQVANKVLHAESRLYYNGIDQNHKSVFYVESAADLRKAASYFTGQTHTNEANCVTIELLTNIDLAGQDWTPWDVMWITLNAHGHKISNLNSNLFGYAGAVKVNDLTLENVISSGNQVGTFAAGTEGSTFNNCVLTGNNKVTYIDAGKEDNGIGAISGITINSNNNVTISAGAKVTLEYNDIADSDKTTFNDYLNGYKFTTYEVNSGKITVNGTLEIGGISYEKEVAANGDIAVTLSTNGTETTTRRGIVEYDVQIKSAEVKEGITVIGNRTFRQCKGLVEVNLPISLTEIGPAVFQTCSKLANVTIPAGVTSIGEGAFAECTSLTSINIPYGVTRLEKDVLRNTGLTSIEIPESVNYIGTFAFRDCESLTEVKILSPEFTIENNTFTNMAAPVPTMTIYVVNDKMKDYLDKTLTNYDKSYITVEVM